MIFDGVFNHFPGAPGVFFPDINLTNLTQGWRISSCQMEVARAPESAPAPL